MDSIDWFYYFALITAYLYHISLGILEFGSDQSFDLLVLGELTLCFSIAEVA